MSKPRIKPPYHLVNVGTQIRELVQVQTDHIDHVHLQLPGHRFLIVIQLLQILKFLKLPHENLIIHVLREHFIHLFWIHETALLFHTQLQNVVKLII